MSSDYSVTKHHKTKDIKITMILKKIFCACVAIGVLIAIGLPIHVSTAKQGNSEVLSSISDYYNSCNDVTVVVNRDTIQKSTNKQNVSVTIIGNNKNLVIVNGDTIVDSSNGSNTGNNNIPSGIDPDYGDMSTSQLDSLANSGDLEALCHLGERYVSGYFAPRNQELGLSFMHKAAQKDNIRALKRLSILYSGEECVKKESSKSV